MLCMSQFYIFSAYYETLWNRFLLLSSPWPNRKTFFNLRRETCLRAVFHITENGGPKERSGEGNGTPLHHSCLENPMDRGAWRTAVHGVAKSQTRLSDFTFTFHFPALEKEMATHSSVLAWRIPGTGEPGRLPSMGSHRVGHDWSDLAAAAARRDQETDSFYVFFISNQQSHEAVSNWVLGC